MKIFNISNGFNVFLQLEKIVGKLKTEKYGSSVLEQIMEYTRLNDSREEQGHEDTSTKMKKTKKAHLDELKGGGSEDRASKRQKTKEDPVLIETSDEDA